MDWLQSAIASGRLVELVLLLVAVEIALITLRAARGRGGAALLPALFAGAGLLLALRAALTGGPPLAVAGWLTAAGLFHLLDLRLRWRAR
jgi:hypothetical protein